VTPQRHLGDGRALSGRTDSADKVDALDAGADDYLTKPFGVDELMARLRAASRRVAPADTPSTVTFGQATVDLAARQVRVRDGEQAVDVRLTPTEWHLLEVLLRHPGQLMSQRRLLAEVWGTRLRVGRRQPARLHGQAPPQAGGGRRTPHHLITEPGMGYRFQPDDGA